MRGEKGLEGSADWGRRPQSAPREGGGSMSCTPAPAGSRRGGPVSGSFRDYCPEGQLELNIIRVLF